METRPLPCTLLTDFAAQVLVRAGVADDAARLTAQSLVEADRRGTHSHGLLRLPLYDAALRSGGINPRPTLSWTHRSQAVAVLDADGALGQVAMEAAVTRVSRLARDHGIGAVAVQNSTHYGAGAHWTHRLAEEGLAAVLTSTTGPVVAPHGSTETLLGTNPLSITVPSSDEPHLTADLATSAGAYGKVVAARNEGRPIPPGWAVDAAGRPTEDPEEAIDGALLPFGGAKGSAVAVLVEALSASLTDAAYAHRTRDIWADRSSRMNTGHLVVALDTAAFTGRAHTEQRVRDLQQRIRGSSPADGAVRAPGDVEHDTARASGDRAGLAPSTVASLDALAREHGLVPLTDRVGPHHP
ncbi:Ldh family oxidoreductase [Nocardiopsis sp. HNM0947]|uniref:Ldh family oxidoreductase n=1 Tax=Nocardiopsis coralli TaxID=2772213 RepID=A0ABR9P6B4_9ACTN|nr:Ldh family oxidoreductase [Nocardiopsis coralli]MBE2999379.1 Ldh family oxidoreductase [Nocardiopsis coralli]